METVVFISGVAEGNACEISSASSFSLPVVGRSSTIPRTSCVFNVLLTRHGGLINAKAELALSEFDASGWQSWL